MATGSGHEDFTKAVIPARSIQLITPNDALVFSHTTRGISFAVAGDLAVVTRNNETITIPTDALAAGVIHPIEVKQVLSTGTTATGIVGYW